MTATLSSETLEKLDQMKEDCCLGRCIWTPLNSNRCISKASAYDYLCDSHRFSKRHTLWGYKIVDQAIELLEQTKTKHGVLKAAKKLSNSFEYFDIARGWFGTLDARHIARDLACVALSVELYTERPLTMEHLQAARQKARIRGKVLSSRATSDLLDAANAAYKS